MKFVKQHSDSLFLSSVILGLILGAGVLYSQWQVLNDYWTTNFDKHSINPDDVVSGGTYRDTRIVPIDRPSFASVARAQQHFYPTEPVIVVDYYGIHRAYPLTILAAHEIVNDRLNDTPVAVTFCPLCNSAIVYNRQVDEQVLRMGVSGNFYGNNFLMYDHQTESWWYQLTGEAVVGDFTGAMLDVIPSQVVGFRTFAERYPTGDVLIGDANNPSINYDMSPYDAYQSSRSPVLSHGDYDPRMAEMSRVLSTIVDNVPIAYPFAILQQEGIINHEVAGKAIVAFWQPGVASTIQAQSSATNDVGQAAIFGREVDGQFLTFYADSGRIFDEETDSEWNIFGEAIAGELTGKTLYDYNCFTQFWFAWSSTYPNTLIYTQ